MSPATHLFASWLIAAKTTNNLRDRRLVALSGILPDLDGAGIFVDFARHSSRGGEDFFFYQKYHHLLLHGLFGAVLIAAGLACFAQERWRVAILSFLLVHVHLFKIWLDRGVRDLKIFGRFFILVLSAEIWIWMWRHQWPLEAWPNRLLSIVLFFWCLKLAVTTGDSFVGVFNRRIDSIFVATLRRWTNQWRLRMSERATKPPIRP